MIVFAIKKNSMKSQTLFVGFWPIKKIPCVIERVTENPASK